MVDIMSQNDDPLGKCDFEDGELPEDGEICDDEEDESSKISDNPSVSNEKEREPRSERDRESRDSERERHRERSRDREREREKDPRERDRERDRSRRFDEQPPRDLDPFGPSDEGTQPEYFGDKDYRSTIEEDTFNDIDYRVNRRRRHSPGPDDSDYESRNKRPYFGRGGFRGGHGGGFRGARPRFNTEHQICKFFREGYCRDGDNCAYSHQTEDSLRRPILCNYYANSFCKKGLQCLMLHGEFPCVEFHKGQCHNEQCRFSHVPLTEYTRPLFEKRVSEEEGRNQRYENQQNFRAAPAPMLPPSSVGAMPPRRRVLLPGGPTQSSTSPPHDFPIIHAPVPHQAPLNGQLPPPSVVVPTIHKSANYQPVGYFNQVAPIQQNLPPPRTIEPPRPVSQTQPIHEKPVQPAFNLEAMLNKLAKGGALDSDDDESPASPPPANQTTTLASIMSNNATKLIPDSRPITWKLLEIEHNPPYSLVENAEQLPTNDPRRARALTEQFDAFSNLLGGSGSGVETSYSFADPRLQCNSYDLGYQEPKKTTNPISSWMPQMS